MNLLDVIVQEAYIFKRRCDVTDYNLWQSVENGFQTDGPDSGEAGWNKEMYEVRASWPQRDDVH